MSHNNKISLWKKLKQLLITAVPQAIINKADARHGSLPEDSIGEQLQTDLNSEANLLTNSALNSNTDSTLNSDTDSNSGSDNHSNNESLKSDDAQSLSINTANNSRDDTPILDYLQQYLQGQQWHYTHYSPKSSDSQQSHHLSLRMKNKQIDCGYLFRIQEDNSLLAVYGILPFLIPESHQSAAMLLITQINYDMLIGNLELDVNDGEIRYKNAIDVEVVGIDDDIIAHLLQSVIAMTTVAYEIFSDLINTQNPAEDIPTLLGELHQQADARTFFLPTQFVQ
jgi:hypothetical protein